MATENLSYQEVLIFIKNNLYTFAFKYFEILSSLPPISNIMKSHTSLQEENLPSLNGNYHFFISRKMKHKSRSSPKTKTFLPTEPSYSSPNGSYLNYLIDQGNTLVNNTNDFSWVQILYIKLSKFLVNLPLLLSSSSVSSPQSLTDLLR